MCSQSMCVFCIFLFQQTVISRWTGLAGIISASLTESHPPKKEWSSFICDTSEKAKIKQFISDPKLLGIGGLSANCTKFLTDLEKRCIETLNEKLRTWWETESEEGGGMDELKKAQIAAKLALAVAVAAKAVWFKIPKAKSKKDKEKIVEEANKHISKANVQKDWLCFVCVQIPMFLGAV